MDRFASGKRRDAGGFAAGGLCLRQALDRGQSHGSRASRLKKQAFHARNPSILECLMGTLQEPLRRSGTPAMRPG
ncbi:hypothetical protein SBA4_2520002 [Candidatus Sulfopaludibacter sp. SbA4]|nr:hypothetical protein SBA4_2520002 [Candidatus Sulfopaludibacter sp. SbA4]